MASPTGESNGEVLRLDFDRLDAVIEFHFAKEICSRFRVLAD